MKYSKGKSRILGNLIKVGLMSTFIAISPTLVAESVSLSEARQSDQNIQTPKNGLKKENVEAMYGAPVQRVSAVGEPPISKWVYQEFTVYFEHDIVLHAVVHKS